MPLVIADRVRETSTTVGTGTLTLDGAVASYQSFSAIGNGNTVYYTIVNQSANEWEVGIGTYTASGTTLSRDTVLSSSNSGSLVNFGAGTKDVWGDYPAGKAVTTDTLAYPPAIGGTTPNAATFTTLTSTGQTNLGNSMFGVTPKGTNLGSFEAGPGSYTQESYFGYTNSSTYAAIRFNVRPNSGGGGFFFTTYGTPSTNGSTQFAINHTSNAVNYVQVTGAATTVQPIISAQGSDTNIPLSIRSKGTGALWFGSSDGAIQFSVATTTSSVNRLSVAGAATNTEPVMSAVGTDTNISMAFQSKGTGGISLSTGSTGTNLVNGTTVTAITRTAGGSLYTSFPSIAIAAPTTAGGVQATATVVAMATTSVTIVSGGTGYTNGDVLTVSGGTTWAGGAGATTLTVTSVSGGVITGIGIANFGSYTTLPTTPNAATGGTGTGATFNFGYSVNSAFTITNAGSGYVEQPTVTFSGGGGSGAAAYATVGGTTTLRSLGSTFNFVTPQGSTAFQISDALTSTPAYLSLNANQNFVQNYIAGGASANTGIQWATKGAGIHQFATNGTTTNVQFNITHTASAVNYVQVTGAATTASPTISAQGSDTNISLTLSSKGSNDVVLTSGTGGWINMRPSGITTFYAANVTNGVNYFVARAGATGSVPSFTATGSDTNIGMALIGKGTGAIDLAAGSSGVNISNGGTVTGLRVTAFGSYTSIPTVAISAPTTAGGVQATANAAVFFGSATIVSGGTGYTAGDVLTVVGGTFTTAGNINVTSVSGGVITGVSVTQGGSYTALPTNPVSVTGGTGTGATFNLGSVGVNNFTITNAGSGYVEQPTVTFSGGGGSGAAAYASIGSNPVIKGLAGGSATSGLTFANASGNVLSLVDGLVATPATLYIRNSGNSQIYPSSGSLVISGGTGTNGISFYSNAANTLQMTVAATASAVNYVQVAGAQTTARPAISAQGSDTNIGLNLITKGSSGIFMYATGGSNTLMTFAHSTNGVNYFQSNNAATGASPTLQSIGADTNIGLNLTTKGTGSISLNTGGGEQLRIADEPSAGRYIQVQGGQPGITGASVGVQGGAGSFDLYANGGNPIRLSTNARNSLLQLQVAHTASAVNYVQVTGAATGSPPAITVQGSDSNIRMNISSKGSESVDILTNNTGTRAARFTFTASSVNWVQMTGAAAGAAPSYSVAGNDTNIDLALTAKGAGNVVANCKQLYQNNISMLGMSLIMG